MNKEDVFEDLGWLVIATLTPIPFIGLAASDESGIWTVGMVFIVADLAGYILHRVMHLGALWGVHRVHHTIDGHVYTLAAARSHPIERLLAITTVVSICISFGLNTAATLSILWGITFWQLVTHTNLWRKAPSWGILVSTRFHNEHHNQNNKNFSIVFDWDSIFGTRYNEKHTETLARVGDIPVAIPRRRSDKRAYYNPLR